MHITNAKHFYLPDLFSVCPLEKGVIFPGDYEAIGAESKAWINAFDALTERQRNIFNKTNSELLSARAFPYASEERFRICCDCLNLLARPAHERVSTISLLIFFVAKAHHSFRKRFYEKLRQRSAKRFLQHIEDYIDAFVFEAHLREKGEILDLASYPTLRRNNSANHISFDFVAFGLDLDLPNELFEDPDFLRVYYAAGDMIWWSNDVYSFKMEHNKGHGGSNIVTILMHELGMDLQTAANFVGEEYRKLMEAYFAERKNIKSWGKEIDADLGRYFDGLGQWVIANMEWSFETKRYFGDAFEEVRKTRLVKL